MVPLLIVQVLNIVQSALHESNATTYVERGTGLGASMEDGGGGI